MFYAHKRQQFLVDQGYQFEVVQEMDFMKDEKKKRKLKLSTQKEQLALLQNILDTDDNKFREEDDGVKNY